MQHPKHWRSLPFSKRDRLPQSSGVYAVLNWHGRIMYIGMSGNLRKRWKDKSHHRFKQADQLWRSRIVFHKCANYKEVEKELIAKYETAWNDTPVPSDRSIHLGIFARALIIAALLALMAPVDDLRFLWANREIIQEHLIQQITREKTP